MVLYRTRVGLLLSGWPPRPAAMDRCRMITVVWLLSLPVGMFANQLRGECTTLCYFVFFRLIERNDIVTCSFPDTGRAQYHYFNHCMRNNRYEKSRRLRPNEQKRFDARRRNTRNNCRKNHDRLRRLNRLFHLNRKFETEYWGIPGPRWLVFTIRTIGKMITAAKRSTEREKIVRDG